MTKDRILNQIRSELEAQLERILGAARESQTYATDQDNKAESKYDTRSLEASYLARGQAAKAEELAQAIADFGSLEPREFSNEDSIAPGALVEVESGGERAFYLLAPRGGGITCEFDGAMLTVVTPTAPLFQNLTGRRVGESLDRPRVTILGVR